MGGVDLSGDETRGRKWWWAGLGLAIAVLWTAYSAWAWPRSEGIGTFGDSFGALNTLFSGLALAAMAYTLWMQSVQLEHQRTDLALTRDEMALAREEMVLSRRVSEGQEAAMREQLRTMRAADDRNKFEWLRHQYAGAVESIGLNVQGLYPLPDGKFARVKNTGRQRGPAALAHAMHKAQYVTPQSNGSEVRKGEVPSDEMIRVLAPGPARVICAWAEEVHRFAIERDRSEETEHLRFLEQFVEALSDTEREFLGAVGAAFPGRYEYLARGSEWLLAASKTGFVPDVPDSL